MKKYLLGIGLIFLIFIISSCGFNNPYSNVDEKASDRISQVITLINAEDSEGLRSVFQCKQNQKMGVYTMMYIN